MTKKGHVSPVAVGDHIKSSAGEFTVKPSCGGPAGRWYCATHDESFSHQFQKDSHIHYGKHKLAWMCILHGLEVP